ncbi:methionyl-tRNA formyltransferase [Agromyces aerolatus]|uniref:methionyl-tRNA formyltransferase n=1 Tax=Agromyces sp. LY-1074 TaxID=3074080 RepID=UPI002864D2D9|nr:MULTISPECIES: methionyl-tRNA formyltransferase [unclassified Agromyces]MDR5700639.1 methionyl-tRNA formyltransferase [Agromyces sp. LY-1074]MDR5707160.1 methionyl-tRNA formyltransferase [Agromyces sp. LY-1358]
MPQLRIVFAGTPAPAVPTLRRLAAGPHEVVGVVTRPPAPLGRKRVLTPSPVHTAADELGIPVIEAARLDETATRRIAALEPDLGVIVAYGGLVREPLLSRPTHGWVNLHFSLLPAWRGAAPVQHALIAGDRVTGASVFQLVPELDAGDVYRELRREVEPHETAGDLLAALAEDGAALVADVADGIADGSARATPQTGEPTFAPKLTIEDARLDWTRPTAEVDARFRGVTPEPGAFTEVDGVRLKVLEATPVDHWTAEAGAEPTAAFLGADLDTPAGSGAATGTHGPGRIVRAGKRVLVGTADGAIELGRVQPAGRTAMAAADWWRGLGVDEAVAR